MTREREKGEISDEGERRTRREMGERGGGDKRIRRVNGNKR